MKSIENKIDIKELSTIYNEAGIELLKKLDDFFLYLINMEYLRTDDYIHSDDFDDREPYSDNYLAPPNEQEIEYQVHFQNKYKAKFYVDIDEGYIYKNDPKDLELPQELIVPIPWEQLDKPPEEIKLLWCPCKMDFDNILLPRSDFITIGALLYQAKEFIKCYRKGKKL